jgi:hypothetical protein
VAGGGQVTIALETGSIAQASLTSEPLTAPQAEAAGIDPDDPANQNVYRFEIHLAVFGTPVDFSGYTTSGNGIVSPLASSDGNGLDEGSGCDGWDIPGTGEAFYPRVEYVAGTPQILWTVIPGKAQWLKEFFSVEMLVTNLGSSAFTPSDGTVSLADLPDGLSLAPTATPQSLEQTMPDIAGGASEKAGW